MPFLVLVCILLSTASGAEEDAAPAPALHSRLPHLDELFKWAEYDSVISQAEQLSRDTVGAAPKDMARIRLDLGVAYYSKGRVIESAEQFVLSHRLAPDLSLDPLYVDKEILDHYRFTLESEAYLDSQRQAAALSPERISNAWIRRRSGWFAIGGGAVAVAGGALSVYQFSRGESASQDLRKAASVTGNAVDYASAKSAVADADRWTVAFGAVGAAGLATGGFFLWKYLARDRKTAQVPEAVRVSLSLPGQGRGFLLTVRIRT